MDDYLVKSSGTGKSTAVGVSDTPKSGGRSSGDSGSPWLTRGIEDPVDVDDSPVTSETGDLGYDDNPRKGFGTDPWAPSH